MIAHAEIVRRRAGRADKRSSKMEMRPWTVLLVLMLLLAVSGQTAEADAPKPGPGDKCAVCGMFVAEFPNWISVVVFKDGTRTFFDGPKDMFRYLLDLKRYNPTKQAKDVADVFVTDYYTLAPVDGRKAWYVSGSDIHGPMGQELVPLGKEVDAKAFLKDHKGKKVLKFEDITPEVVAGLGHGKH